MYIVEYANAPILFPGYHPMPGKDLERIIAERYLQLVLASAA